MSRNEWVEIGKIAQGLCSKYSDLWQAGIPGGDASAPPQLEAQVDAWCRELVRENLFGASHGLSPHDYLKPWLLARLLSAEIGALKQINDDAPRAAESKQEALEYLLIEWWHSEMKSRWWRLGKGDSFSA